MGQCISKTSQKPTSTTANPPLPQTLEAKQEQTPKIDDQQSNQNSMSIRVMAGSGGTKEPLASNLENSMSERLPRKSILKSVEAEGGKHSELDNKRVLELCSKTTEQISSQEEHLEALKQLIKRLNLLDLAHIKGLKKILAFEINLDQRSNLKKRYETSGWNPLLHAVASGNIGVVKVLVEFIPSFHKLSCLSKPYSLEAQKEKVFDHSKRLKRECFALRLAIMKKDEEMLKYLWNEQRLLWNLGHFFVCLKAILKGAWEQGLKILLVSSTSKVIFYSVNTSPSDFIDVLDMLSIELSQYDQLNAEFAKFVRNGLNSRPYVLFAYFLELSNYSKTPDQKQLQKWLKQISEDDLQFTHSDFAQIFDIIKEGVPDDNPRHGVLLETQKQLCLQTFQNRDKHVSSQFGQLKFLFENIDVTQREELSKVCEELLDIIDDLDLLALNTININGKKTNALLEAFNFGIDLVSDYFLNEDYFNIRSTLKKNNPFEIENEISQVNVSFFLQHAIKNQRYLKKLYYSLIDILQLSSFLELFNSFLSESNPLSHKVALFILADQHFKSLFIGSLEFQKYIFVKQVKEISEENKIEEVYEVLRKEPYAEYLVKIEEGNFGEEYASKTIAHLKKKAQEKLGIQQEEEKAVFLKESPLIDADLPQSKSSPQSAERQLKETGNFRIDSKQDEGSIIHGDEAQMGIIEKSNYMSILPLNSEQDRRPDQSVLFSPLNGNGTENIFSPSVDVSGIGIQITQVQNAQPLKTFEVLESHQTGRTLEDIARHQELETKLRERLSIIESEGGMNFEDDEEDRSLGKDVEDDDAMNLSKRVPQPTSQIKHQFLKDDSVIIGMNQQRQVKFQGFEQVFRELVITIRESNLLHVKALMKKFNVKNIASLRNLETEANQKGEQVPKSLKVKGRDAALAQQNYDTSLWNPVLFAIYYQKADIIKCLLQDHVAVSIIAIRQPPPNEFTEYISPYTKRNDQNQQSGQNLLSVVRLSPEKLTSPLRNNFTGMQTEIEGFQESVIIDRMGDETFDRVLHIQTGRNPVAIDGYYPSDARVECFGVELAIRNRDIHCFRFLWNELNDIWEERHFAYVLDKVLQEYWDVGLGTIFRSKTSHTIYRSMPPQDRDNFLFSKIVDKITESQFWENEAVSPLKITQKQVDIIIAELSYDPYGSYAVLRFPQLFQKMGLLESTLKKVQFEDIQDFVIARQENVSHLSDFISKFTDEGAPQLKAGIQDRQQIVQHEKIITQLNSILKRAQGLHQQHQLSPISLRSEELNPESLVKMIKQGDTTGLRRLLESGEGVIMLEKLNLMTGFEDPEHMKYFMANVKYEPTDSLMRHLISDGSQYLTIDWNPLIFAIYYQKLEIVEFLCKSPLVYVRSCLVKPFQLVPNQMMSVDDEIDDDENFVTEKSELFALILSVMLNNRDIFRMLLKRCGFLWNDIHLTLLTNYVLEALSAKSEWIDGLRVLFTSPTTHQIFNSMNLYEKDRYLRFCNKSICDLYYDKQHSASGRGETQTSKSSILSDFRYLMSFEPYNAFYLSIIATTDELQFWDGSCESEDSRSKELFMKTCLLNFDERAFTTLHRYNSHYINEFISIAAGGGNSLSLRRSQEGRTSSLGMFAAKLKKFAVAYAQQSNEGTNQSMHQSIISQQ